MTIELAEQEIRERAHALWEARGRSAGSAEEDWRAAEQQLRAELDAVSSPLPPLPAEAVDTLDADGKAVKPRSAPRDVLATVGSSPFKD